MTKEVQPHGSEAGYRRHQRAGEVACQPCREAWSARRVRQQVNAEQRARESTRESAEMRDERMSELDEIRENLALVVRAMDSAPAETFLDWLSVTLVLATDFLGFLACRVEVGLSLTPYASSPQVYRSSIQ